MTSYKALWRVALPGYGVEYRAVTVISAPVFGHVKCEDRMALPVSELVGLDWDGYAVRVNKPQMVRSATGG